MQEASVQTKFTKAQPIAHRSVGFIIFLSFFFVGCGSERVACYPTSGKVLVDGKPAEGVRVFFIPEDGTEDFMKLRPFEVTDSNGAFTLKTYDKGDGAPAGKYSVFFKWEEKQKKPKAGSGEEEPDEDAERRSRPRPKSRIAKKYTHKETSGITIEIKSGENLLEPFELTSK